MEDMKNTDLEVTTEVSEAEDLTQEIVIDDASSGPSKGFIALIVGGTIGLAAAGYGLYKRHKKKKEDVQDSYEEDEIYDDVYEDDLDDSEPVVMPIQAEEKFKENSGKRKG